MEILAPLIDFVLIGITVAGTFITFALSILKASNLCLDHKIKKLEYKRLKQEGEAAERENRAAIEKTIVILILRSVIRSATFVLDALPERNKRLGLGIALIFLGLLLLATFSTFPTAL